MSTQNQTREVLQAVAALSAQVVKMAGVMNAKQASAPKAVDPEQLTKTAAALVDTGWAQGHTKEAVAKLLGDPNTALETLENLAVEAAKRANEVDKRLANGRPTEKIAMSESSPFGLNFQESEADARYNRALSGYVHQNGSR